MDAVAERAEPQQLGIPFTRAMRLPRPGYKQRRLAPPGSHREKNTNGSEMINDALQALFRLLT